MLAEFVSTNRAAIIARAQARVATRTSPKATDVELTNGIPVFLDQLSDALRREKATGVIDHDDLSQSARRHGADLLRMGLTVAQVVRDYGDVCQAITDLAVEQDAAIAADDFRALNLCLDDAIAEAVTEYSRQHDRAVAAAGSERLGVMAHELRNVLNTATLSFESIREGHVTATGSTGLMHGRSLMALRDLVDHSLTEVRLDANMAAHESISVAHFVEEIEIGGLLHAQTRAQTFTVSTVDPTVTIEGDRQILAAAVSNLLQNAFKFSKKEGNVSLTTRVTATRVLFDVEDECGGLPPGDKDDLFRAFEQRGADRTGLGLGLSISVRGAKANGGEIQIRDLPGKGCVFTLDVPRVPPPPLTVIDGGKTRAGGASPGETEGRDTPGASVPPKAAAS